MSGYIQTCTERMRSFCSDDFVPSPEKCDGVDNNCDGLTDEGLGQTTCGLGVCEHTINNCLEGATQTCNPFRGASKEVCDNLDNDCNGIVDDLTRSCYTGPQETREIGGCHNGVQKCIAGVWGQCEGDQIPSEEICDNLDNDCDGTTDGITRSCYTGPDNVVGVGICKEGAEYCERGQWSGNCEGEVLPIPEFCNNKLDDNCDSYTDEGCTAKAVDIAPGYERTCAVFADGSQRCWGSNEDQRLNVATSSETCRLGRNQDSCRRLPTPIENLSDIVQTALGIYPWGYTCSVLETGAMWCWGSNLSGQLGNGSSSSYIETPTRVVNISDVVQAELGYEHTCALLEGGAIKCWGLNSSGQVGIGSSTETCTWYYGSEWPCKRRPTHVPGISDVVQVDLGERHTCALMESGAISCWGKNSRGQLGDGTNANHSLPNSVPDLTNVTQIALGGAHTCALQTDATVKCWGANNKGQLGVEDNGETCLEIITYCLNGDNCSSTESIWPCRQLPTPVNGLANIVHIALGEYHSCAIEAGGTVLCWGNNAYGQLGDGTREDRSSPVSAIDLENAVKTSLGDHHSCALLEDGALYCWGLNSHGQLGDGTTKYRSVPTPAVWIE